jgi:hypothetical protein
MGNLMLLMIDLMFLMETSFNERFNFFKGHLIFCVQITADCWAHTTQAATISAAKVNCLLRTINSRAHSQFFMLDSLGPLKT